MNKQNLKGILICVVALAASVYFSAKRAQSRYEEKVQLQETEYLKGCEQGTVATFQAVSELIGNHLEATPESIKAVCEQLRKQGPSVPTTEVGY